MTRPTYRGMNVDEYARDYVQDAVDRGQSLQAMLEGQCGMYAEGIRRNVGSGRQWDLERDKVVCTTKRDELFVMIGDEWKVFNLPKLYAQCVAGVKQGTLL